MEMTSTECGRTAGRETPTSRSLHRTAPLVGSCWSCPHPDFSLRLRAKSGSAQHLVQLTKTQRKPQRCVLLCPVAPAARPPALHHREMPKCKATCYFSSGIDWGLISNRGDGALAQIKKKSPTPRCSAASHFNRVPPPLHQHRQSCIYLLL